MVSSSWLVVHGFMAVFLLTILSYQLPITSALSRTFDITDTEAVSGDIMIYQDGEFKRATEAYSPNLFGVLEADPIIVQQTGTGQPITTNGTANVNVTSSNGTIKAGDYITSSTNPGKGQKADRDGPVLGKALADLDGEGQIPVEVYIQNTGDVGAGSGGGAANRFFNTIDAILQKNLESQEASFKLIQYILAALVFLGSIIFSFLSFTRSIPKSIEAIGRNPLAKRSIQVSIIITSVLTIFVTLLGVIASLMILRL